MYTVEYYSAIRNDEYPPFASMWMELEGIMLSEVMHGHILSNDQRLHLYQD